MKKKISVSLDEDVIEKLKKIAKREERTPSNLLNKIAKDFIKKEEE